MKFYNIEVWECSKEGKECLGKIVVLKTNSNYQEAVSKVIVHSSKKEAIVNKEMARYGFSFVFYQEDLIEKNYAKKEEVETYLKELETHPFHLFLKDHQYVFGTDQKEVKKLIKNYQKGKPNGTRN